ncbi:hypothetical protein J7W08_05385 [Methanococcoides orientis]|uniref:hypothetical protein n=1 Tax=Methanococcoides orientis TaxID=2822137 RepID=UPI001E5FBEB5|nr:hypothetical protein [Methanococcoides orientis]UGV41711.1 hypothetical protein J7W08_05385 [Methanococcoides orientis]
MESRKDSLSTHLGIFLVLVLVYALLSRFAVVNSPVSPAQGVSGIYFAAAVMIAFVLWYGMWGALAAYFGCLLGAASLIDMPFSLSLIWSLADFWQVLIPLIAFVSLGADITLKTRRDLAIFLVFGLFLNNLVGAVWGSSVLVAGGIVPWSEYRIIFQGWFIGNLVVTIFITPLLLRFVTPYLRNTRSYVMNYWS